MKKPAASLYQRIYAMIRRIPAGSVASYGQIAKLVGGCSARQVGYALSALPNGTAVPWQRVINNQGKISLRSAGDNHDMQRRLLEDEGIVFYGGCVDMTLYRWSEGAPAAGRMPDPEQEFSDIKHKGRRK